MRTMTVLTALAVLFGCVGQSEQLAIPVSQAKEVGEMAGRDLAGFDYALGTGAPDGYIDQTEWALFVAWLSTQAWSKWRGEIPGTAEQQAAQARAKAEELGEPVPREYR